MLDQYDFAEHVMRCYEAQRLQEAADTISGDARLEQQTLHAMLSQFRCLPYALQYTTSLRHLSPPEPAALASIGSQARAFADETAGGRNSPMGGERFVEAVRATTERALRLRWPEVDVHAFGSTAIGLATEDSDVDLCVVLPSTSRRALPRSERPSQGWSVARRGGGGYPRQRRRQWGGGGTRGPHAAVAI